MCGGIYIIRNKENGRYYVGRSESFRARFNRHRYELRHGRHHCVYLQRAWNKYGEDAFEFVVMIECEVEEAKEIEGECLSSGDPLLYNVSRMSSGGDFLSHHPDRDRIMARRSESVRRHMAGLAPQERIRRYGRPGERNGMYGRKHTEAARRKMSETTLLNVKHGPEHHNFGLKRSEATRTRMSQVAASRTGEKNSFHGRTHSQATREKLAASRRGKLPPNVRPVCADGTVYPSVTEAARRLGVTPALVIYRIKSPKYAYAYVELGVHSGAGA